MHSAEIDCGVMHTAEINFSVRCTARRLTWRCDVLRIYFFISFIWFYYIIYTVLQCDLPPLRPHCGEAPGRDSNLGRAAHEAWTLDTTPRPPHLLFFVYFLAPGGGSPLYPEIFTLVHNDPAAHQDHCGRCRIQTRDLCARSLVQSYQRATDEKSIFECFF